MRRQCRFVAIALVLGCGSSSTAPGVIDVNGNWGGTLTYQTASRTVVTPLAFSLLQTGSQVAGTMFSVSGAGRIESGAANGSVAGSSLELITIGMKVSADDCHLYPVTLTFDVGSVLTLKSITGPDCRGDNMGGHQSIAPIISGTLVMTKQ
jgi:hypothetical protein